MKRFVIKLAVFFIPVSFVTAQTSHTVQMLDNSFSPATINVNIGDTVIWVNNGAMIHTSTSGSGCTTDGVWNSGNLNPGASFAYVFTTTGIFNYICVPHCGEGMAGAVTVDIVNSVVEKQNELKLNVSPNPVRDYLDISWSTRDVSEIMISLLDLTGRELDNYNRLYISGTSGYRIDMAGLPAGMYMLRLKADNGYTRFYKFVKH